MRTHQSTKRTGRSATATPTAGKRSKPGTKGQPAAQRRPPSQRPSATNPTAQGAAPKAKPKRKPGRQRRRVAERQRARVLNQRKRQAGQRARRRQATKLRRRQADRHCQLNGRGVQAHTISLLQKCLQLPDFSATCSAALVFTVLLAAAGQCASIAATCFRLEQAPSEQTIYNALNEILPDYAELERRVNRTLRANLPKNLRRRRQRLAIDLTLIPYHGQPEAALQEIYRSQAKHGTSHFHAYASLYVVCRGQRFTVALIWVQQSQPMKEVVQRLLVWGRRAGVRPQLLLLDRGFYSVAVIGYLKRARVPFLMPAVARGRRPAEGQPASGIRAFKLWKRGGWGEHTLDNGRRREKVKIAVYCGNYRGQWQRHGRYAWVYAYWGFRPGSARWLADTYRTRFGIETSYRQMNQARIKTSTRSPLNRYLYVALALILRNMWVWLHWEVLSTPRRGPRRLNLPRLTLEGMLVCMVHAIEALLGICERFVTERPLPKLLTANTC